MSTAPLVPGFTPRFWEIPTVQAFQPELAYLGPMLEPVVLRTVVPGSETEAYVYVIFDNLSLDVLYVGKTIDPASRMSSHRAMKEWWQVGSWVAFLRVHDTDGIGSENSAYYLERICIRHLKPLHNASEGRH